MAQSIGKGQNKITEDINKLYICINEKYSSISRMEETLLKNNLLKGGNDAEKAKKRLIEGNLGYVVKLADKFHTIKIERMDLIQEGVLGLIKAADKFDPKNGTKFTTYAYYWIKAYMHDYICNNDNLFKIDKNTQYQINTINKIINKYYEVNSKEPTVLEIAHETGYKEKRVEIILEVIRNTKNTISVGNSDNNLLIDIMDDKILLAAKESEIEQQNQILNQRIQDEINNLTVQEKKVVELHLGFKETEPLTFSKISVIMNITPVTVSRTYKNAIGKLSGTIDADYLKNIYVA